jgi:hypothetical protein
VISGAMLQVESDVYLSSSLHLDISSALHNNTAADRSAILDEDRLPKMLRVIPESSGIGVPVQRGRMEES